MPVFVSPRIELHGLVVYTISTIDCNNFLGSRYPISIKRAFKPFLQCMICTNVIRLIVLQAVGQMKPVTSAINVFQCPHVQYTVFFLVTYRFKLSNELL